MARPRSISPERLAAVRLDAVARRCGPTAPTGSERARIVAELQEAAAEWPHLLAECAGQFLGSHRVGSLGRENYLVAAELLIEAGADLADVERWAASTETYVRQLETWRGY